jgi:hypothetical protein
MPTKRPSKKSAPRFALAGNDLAIARKLLPRGAMIYGILRSHAASGTRTIELVVAKGKTINRVWPSIGKAAGLRYNTKSDGFMFTGGGYSAMQEAAESLSRGLYGKGNVIKYESSYL